MRLRIAVGGIWAIVVSRYVDFGVRVIERREEEFEVGVNDAAAQYWR